MTADDAVSKTQPPVAWVLPTNGTERIGFRCLDGRFVGEAHATGSAYLKYELI